jgi:hypothetical protein
MSVRKERVLLLIWLIANFAVGLWIVRDFGLSYDESNYYRYADYTLEAYKSFFGRLYEPDYAPSNLKYYGPAFILIVNSIIQALQKFPLEFSKFDTWHYSYFVIFQLTGLCLYGLAKRWFSRWTAGALMVLFVFQPLLWGHAFINPKDIPFMFFFIFSIWSGFHLVDKYEHKPTNFSLRPWLIAFQNRWLSATIKKKQNFFLLTFTTLIFLVLYRPVMNFSIEPIIRFFYFAESNSWAGKFISNYASQISNTPVNDYVDKARILSTQFDNVFFFFCFLLIAINLINFLSDRSFVENTQILWQILRKLLTEIREIFHLQKVGEFFRQVLKALVTPKVIFAGIILGLTISVRILGPLAGLIVVLFLFLQLRWKSIPISLAYFLWAGVITYLTWPFLWLAPVSRFFESLTMMSNFPWQGKVFFGGEYYFANEIPVSYIPVLLNTQFTEPLILLLYFGLGIFFYRIFFKSVQVDLVLYFGLGSFLPILGLIALHSPLYDNIRQLLFLIPPMFIICGFVLEALIRKITQNWARLAVIFLLVLPGLFPIVRLHPFQYIYYNSFVGGVRGASCCYEMDYWRTSMKGLATKVNEIANPGERVVYKGGSVMMIDEYFRSDLVVEKYQYASFDLNGEYDYAMLHSRYDEDEYYYPEAEIIAVIEKDGVILGVVKRVDNQNFR